jgi:hypothetical protein
MICAQFFFQKRPKFTLQSPTFGQLFFLKIPYFWPDISLSNRSYFLRLHFGRYLDRIGRFFHKTSGHTEKE